MKTTEVWDLYLKSKIFSPETLRKYEFIKNHFSAYFPEFPSTALEINQYLLSLKLKDITVSRRKDILKSLYKFMEINYDFPNPFKKVMKIKINKEPRRYFTPQELHSVINAASEGWEKVLILLLIDSPCRIGELGQHKEAGNKTYPGLRVDMLRNNTMNVRGKTGGRAYRLDPTLFQACIKIAAPNGQVFTSTKHPEGMTTKALQEAVRNIITRAGITGPKLGPHTLRHSAASLVAQKTGNVLIIKALLQDTETKNAMVYIHDVEDNLKQTVSPLKMLAEEVPAQHQPLLIPEQTVNNSTALTVQNPIEQVEGTVDLSEGLFPQIPEDIKPIRPMLNYQDLKSMREAFVYFARYAPLNNTTGHLSQMMKTMLRKKHN